MVERSQTGVAALGAGFDPLELPFKRRERAFMRGTTEDAGLFQMKCMSADAEGLHLSFKLGAGCMASLLASLASFLDGMYQMQPDKFCQLPQSQHGVLCDSLR